ncbi:MAG: CoA transferase [Dehalococcoidia bacterium]|nr:CoA transferase [Dehalococcoidia bacterium]
MTADGPFSGLRVVEFGRFIAAPYCCQLLADGGADVIKVEDVIGDETRRNGPILETEGRQFLNKNRGKRSLAVDLGHPEVLAAVRRIADGADVIVANFRPGQAERLGLDYAAVRTTNPRIVYAENTAFGTSGPLAGMAGMDIAMVGYSGLAQFTPGGPMPLAEPVVDYTAGLLLAWGISTALYHRERTGEGQKLDVSLLHAALVLENNNVNHVDVIDGWRPEFVDYLKTAFSEGKTWEEILRHRDSLQPFALARAYYGFYRTADGVIAIAALGRPLQRRVIEILGIEDRWVSEPGWLPEDARAHVEQVVAAAEAVFACASNDAWTTKLRAAGVSVCPVQFREQLLDDEQALANGDFVTLEHDLVGTYRVVAPPVRFSASPLRAGKASPVLGRDTHAILQEAGVSNDDIQRLANAGAITVAN